MKKYIISLALIFCVQIFAQNNSKKYKYVIVPLQYGFTSKPNQFQLNVLTRVLLQQEGFEVFMSEGEEIPEHVANNPCSTLKADVKKDRSILSSNLRFQLFNCYGNLVFESTGTSRIKSFDESYKEALRMAMREFQIESYKYLKTDTDEVAETPVEQTDETPKSFEERATRFKEGEKEYWMVKENEDYLLYEDLGETIWATLKFADKGTYSFDSEHIDGAAYFTPEGHIVVEYLAKNKDAVQKMTIVRQ